MEFMAKQNNRSYYLLLLMFLVFICREAHEGFFHKKREIFSYGYETCHIV